MNKLDFISSREMNQTVDHALRVEQDSTHRLIVLIPDGLDFHAATHSVWELANNTGMHVQLLALGKDVVEELSLHRSLVTMAALIQDGRIHTEAKTEIGTNWLDLVKRNYRAGDMIVCFAEQRTGLLHRPLSQMIQSRWNAPLYIMSGLCQQERTRTNWLNQFWAWSGSIGIIAVSALFQIRITSLSQDWTQIVLLIMSVLAEIWLIWGWNSLLS